MSNYYLLYNCYLFFTTTVCYIETESDTFLGGTTLTQSRGAGVDDDGTKGDVKVVKGCVVLTGVGLGVGWHEWDVITTLQDMLQYAV